MFLIIGYLFIISQNNLNYLDSLYKAGDYQTVVHYGEGLLTQTTDKASKVEILRMVAFANVALDRKEKAKENFLSLLALAPNYYLDSLLTSPKIIEIFSQAKNEFVQNQPTRQQKSDPLRYFYPGLVQIQQGKRGRGYLLLSIQTVSILGFVTTSILTPIYHQKYLDQTVPTEIDRSYNQYKAVYILRQIFCSGIIFSYGVHILDLRFFE